jgi:hypothetical protein
MNRNAELVSLQNQVRSLKGQMKKGTKPSSSVSNRGTLTVAGYEYWSNIPTANTSVNLRFLPGASLLPRLDQFAALYDLYRINSVEVHYRPAVGTTANGIVHMGIDYDASDTPTTISDITVLDPSVSVTVYREARIRPEISRLQRLKWYFTTSGGTANAVAGFLCSIISPLASSGEVWCKYDVTFTSPCRSQTLTSSFSIDESIPLTIYRGSTDATVGTINRLAGTSLSENSGAFSTQFVDVPGVIQAVSDTVANIGGLTTSGAAAFNLTSASQNPISMPQLLINFIGSRVNTRPLQPVYGSISLICDSYFNKTAGASGGFAQSQITPTAITLTAVNGTVKGPTVTTSNIVGVAGYQTASATTIDFTATTDISGNLTFGITGLQLSLFDTSWTWLPTFWLTVSLKSAGAAGPGNYDS